MGHIQLQNLRIGFNNAGKDMFYEFSSINQDVLHGLKEFLTDLNSNGIVLSKKAFDGLLKDINCTAYEGDADDPNFNNTLVKKSLPSRNLDEAFAQLKHVLDSNNILLSPKTLKRLNEEIGIFNAPRISNPQQENDI